MRILFGFAYDISYTAAGTLFVAGIHESIPGQTRFLQIPLAAILYNFLPPPRNTDLISRLKAPSIFPTFPKN